MSVDDPRARLNPLQRFVVWVAREEDRPSWWAWSPRWEVLLFLVPCAFIGVPFGLGGVYIGAGVGSVLMFTTPAYGRRLTSQGRRGRPRQRRQALEGLLASCRPWISRGGDVQLMIDAGTERDALLLIAGQLKDAASCPDYAAYDRLASAAATLGLRNDPEVIAAVAAVDNRLRA